MSLMCRGSGSSDIRQLLGMTVTVRQLLDDLRSAAWDERDKGDRFERLIASYLRTDPLYVQKYEEVWRWRDWPDRPGSDTGIDLVARERETGELCAIQCKFYDPTHTLAKEVAAHRDVIHFTLDGQPFETDDPDQLASAILNQVRRGRPRELPARAVRGTQRHRALSVDELAAMPAGRAAVSLSGTRPVIVETVPWMGRPDAFLVESSLARYGGPDGHLGPTLPGPKGAALGEPR